MSFLSSEAQVTAEFAGIMDLLMEIWVIWVARKGVTRIGSLY
jgi:hypothetical protein